LQAIGNSLGKFIMVDKASLSAASRKVGRIMVEMDIHLGLPETIEIEWRGRRILQRLDYLGIPFRCSICRSTSHLRQDCKGFDVGVDEPEVSDHLNGSLIPPRTLVSTEKDPYTWHRMTPAKQSQWVR
jgi:hypothetical protein